MLVSVSVAFFGVLFYTYAATTISTNIETAGTLSVTGTSATAFGGALTVTGETNLNGGLKMNTDKFTVAVTSGNTAIAGTLDVTSAVTTLAGITNTGTLANNGLASTTSLRVGSGLDDRLSVLCRLVICNFADVNSYRVYN